MKYFGEILSFKFEDFAIFSIELSGTGEEERENSLTELTEKNKLKRETQIWIPEHGQETIYDEAVTWTYLACVNLLTQINFVE